MELLTERRGTSSGLLLYIFPFPYIKQKVPSLEKYLQNSEPFLALLR